MSFWGIDLMPMREGNTMNPSQEGPGAEPKSFQFKGFSSPFDALKVPSVIRPVATQLLASRTRPDGGVDELYHEVPSLNGHKGAVFYVSDSPMSGSHEASPGHQRVFYAMVPPSGSEKFVSDVVERFKSSPVSFEDCFTNTFKGQLLTEYPSTAEQALCLLRHTLPGGLY
jgi:hypothetical protein